MIGMLCLFFLAAGSAHANTPGGGTGTGPAVTLVDNGNGTLTMANGIVTIVITTNDASIHQIYYAYNNSGSTVTNQLLTGGTYGGELYWTGNPASFGTMNFTYSLVTAGTNYTEIVLTSTSATNGIMEVHYSMLRGSTGFYTTAILTHRSTDGVVTIVLRPNIYAGTAFNWMSVDAARNRLMEVTGGASISVYNAPKETYLWTNGIYAGQYEDKYKYTADLGLEKLWGWSSVGTGGMNVGIWNIPGSLECYPGGPLERSLMEHIGTTILNVFTGGYYGMATDDTLQDGEVWSKVYGPYFYYLNNVTNTLTGTNAPAQALYSDAQAQALAEESVWPYAWFTNANYTPASGRGTVTGRMAIADSGNPNASPAGLWVGVVQQPSTNGGSYDFQSWAKPYEFWVKTDTNGNFSIPDVIAGTNYTLYAFGPGAADTFMSQNQTGGSPPLLTDLPASPFGITVTGGATNALGTVTWTPARVGATVFEIGYPDRTAKKFRHGDDYWVGDIGPSPSQPSPIWTKYLEYPFDFPNGVNYTVGQSRWSTDWNFIQPVMPDGFGNFDSTSSTITFNLATAPTNGATASLYLGLCSDYYAAMIVSVNGNNLAGVTGLSASPNSSVPSSGYYVGYGGSDTSIREGNNGAFSDERLTFPASQLHAGINTINIGFRQIATAYFANHAMYDYVRLELTGYVPPAPASVAAYPGNGGNLVCWPVTPGATSYKILRSTASGGTYASITNGVTGPVCGCGSNNATYFDATAANGTAYYYEVESVNPTGTGTNSPPSAAATPASGLAAVAPAAPAGLAVTASGHQSVTLSWTASAGANYYSVWRSTLMNNGGGASNVLSTVLLNNTNLATTFTDTSPTDGSLYSYFVTATSAGGTSTNSAVVAGRALPTAPSSAPVSLTGYFNGTTNATLNWTPVSGAVGYVIYRATSTNGPFAIVMSVTETNYVDYGLATNTTYFYRVVAVNDGGVSGNATDSLNGLQPAPAGLSAIGTNAQVSLAWSAAAGATNYTLWRGTNAGAENVTVVAGYTGTTYTNSGLVNGTTYYYVVTATGPGGLSGKSPEANATASAAASGIWTASGGGNWGTAANWSGGTIGYGTGNTANFASVLLTNAPAVTLDSSRTISTLIFGDAAGYNWTVTGPGTLTLGASPNINVVNQTAIISAPVAGTAGLTKSGQGALTLGGATETFTNGLTVNAGTVTVDFSVAGSPATNLIPPANALTLGGGTLGMNGTNSAAAGQTFAGTAINTGGNVINLTANGAASLSASFGALAESPGGTVEFIGPATTNATAGVPAAGTNYTTTAGSGTGGLLGNFGAGQNGAWATVGLYDWASTDLPNGTAGASPYTVIGGSQVAGFYQTAGITTGGNYDVNASGVNSLGNAGGAATLRFNSARAVTVSFTATTAQNVQGILVTPSLGPTNANLTGGGLEFIRSSSSGNCYGVVWQNNVKAWLNFASVIEGGRQAGQANGLVQSGPGTVVYTGSGGNYYELGTYLNGGCSVVNSDADFGLVANASTLTLNGGTVVGNATFTMDNAGANQRPITLLGAGGGLAAVAGTTMTIDGVMGSGSGAGPLVIGIPAANANGNSLGLLPGSGSGTANTTAVLATGTVIVTNANYYTGGTVIDSGTLVINGIYALGGGNYGGLTFNGGTLQYQTNFAGNGSGDLTSIGTAGITFLSGTGTIDVNGNTITYGGSIGNYGPGSLIVKSTVTNGSLTLQGANTYSGTTTVTNLTLVANNTAGSATGQGNVTVQTNGVLTGAGIIAGAVTLNNGAQLVPGVPLGTLTLGNNLTLSAGSKTLLRVQHSPLTNSAVSLAGTLTAGGTLTITNTGGSALAAGDSFILLPAGGYAGNFSGITLPALNTGLFWSTAQLMVNGTVGVVSSNRPAITGVWLSGSQLVLGGTNGTPNWSYTVLTSTNLTLPLSQWTPSGTNLFDGGGNFTWTNSSVANSLQQYYFIREQ